MSPKFLLCGFFLMYENVSGYEKMTYDRVKHCWPFFPWREKKRKRFPFVQSENKTRTNYYISND